MKDDGEQQRMREFRAQRQRLRLAETKRRILTYKIAADKRRSERFHIQFDVTRDVAQRAQKACLHTEEVDLISWLRKEVLSFADLIPPDHRHTDRRLRVPKPQDEEWFEMISDYLDTLPPDSERSVSELLDTPLDWPLADRGREPLMRIGRIMKRLRWPRKQVLRNGKRIWIYKKPIVSQLHTASVEPEPLPPPEPTPREPTPEEILADEWKEKVRALAEQRRREHAERTNQKTPHSVS